MKQKDFQHRYGPARPRFSRRTIPLALLACSQEGIRRKEGAWRITLTPDELRRFLGIAGSELDQRAEIRHSEGMRPLGCSLRLNEK